MLSLYLQAQQHRQGDSIKDCMLPDSLLTRSNNVSIGQDEATLGVHNKARSVKAAGALGIERSRLGHPAEVRQLESAQRSILQ